MATAREFPTPKDYDNTTAKIDFLDDKITSPEFYNVNSDPSSQQLQDLHLREQREDFQSEVWKLKMKYGPNLVQISKEVCGMCKNAEKSVQCRCEECGNFMCEQCENIHRNMKLCAFHTIKPISELIEEFKTNLEATIQLSQAEMTRIDYDSNKITRNVNRLQDFKTSEIEKVKQFTSEAVEKLRENEKCIIDNINDVTEILSNKLMAQNQHLSNSKKQIKDMTGVLPEMIHSKDFVSLENCVQNMDEEIERNVSKIKASLPQVTKLEQPVIRVQRNSSALNVKDYVTVETDERLYNNLGPVSSEQLRPKEPMTSEQVVRPKQPNPSEQVKVKRAKAYEPESNIVNRSLTQSAYSNLCFKTFAHQANSVASHSCYKLCEINGQIWSGGANKITVYSKQCEKIRTIKHDSLEDISALALYGGKRVVIAGRTGLHEIDIDGEYQTRVMKGSFHDICVYRDEIYALEWEHQNVVVCSYSHRWQQVRQIQIMYEKGKFWKKVLYGSVIDRGNFWDRLSVCDTGIYISSYNKECIYKYNREGQLMYTVTKDEHRLYLCDVDDMGNSLVADHDNYDNNCINIVQGQTWKALKLTGFKLSYPFHVLLDTDGNLWICTGISRKIVKYRPR